ncbi:MAG: TIR domain-containing protein [Chloroflexota bacterium]
MRLFISYAHVDKVIVKDWIVDNLQVADHTVWIDDALMPGRKWRTQLAEAIVQSDALLFTISPESVRSKVCREEVEYAIAQGKPIIPVLIQARTPLPPLIQDIQYVDFSNGPTEDAVAKLLDALQHVSARDATKTNTSHEDELPMLDDNNTGNSLTFWMTVITTIATVIGVVFAAITFFSSGSNTAAPRYIPQRDVDVRDGPSVEFEVFAVLSRGEAVDIVGIDVTRQWYQILDNNGRLGWVTAASGAGRVRGNVGTLDIVIVTEEPSPTVEPSATEPEPTNTPTQEASSTSEPSDTPTTVPSHTPTDVLSATSTTTPSNTPVRVPSNTPVPSNTLMPAVASYPCDAEIPGIGGLLNQVHVLPSESSPARPPVQRGEDVIVLDDASDFGVTWYQIEYDDNTGWIPESYVTLSTNCP